MPICERESTRAIMVIGRIINNGGGRGWITRLVASAGGGESAIIDAVGMLVDKYKSLRRDHDAGEFIVKAPLTLRRIKIFIEPFAETKHLTHAAASYSGSPYVVVKDSRIISRAPKHRGVAAAVGEQWTGINVDGGIPIALGRGRIHVALHPE